MSIVRLAETIETPGGSGVITADLTKEYAAGGPGHGVGFLRTLALSIDDITADFGDDLYQRMLCDARVASEVDSLRAAIIEDGLQLAPAVADEGADGYALAKAIHAAAERTLDDLETPLDDVLWDMLKAVALGNRIAEECYEYGDIDGRTGLVLTALRVKPRRMVAFVTDAYMRLVGILATPPGGASLAYAGAISPQSPPPTLLPRGKFAVLSFRPEDNDPRGTSVLRPAYTPWSLKLQALREHVKFLARFASPAVIGILSPSARDKRVLDPVTNEPTDEVIRAVDALLASLLEFHNGSALVVQAGTEIKELYSTGEGRAFLNAFGEYNRDIALAISGQTLASSEGEHNARAAAQVHQDTRNTRVRQAKKAVARMMRRDVLQQWAVANWGEAARALTPLVTLGSVEEEDMTPRWNAAAALNRASYLTPSQKAALDPQIGLPQRTPEEVARETEQAQQPPPVAPPGNQPPGNDPNAGDGADDGGAA